MAKFIRILRPGERMEVLLNVAHISKVEVRYGVPSKNPNDESFHSVTLRDGLSNPAAVRHYTIYIGGEGYKLSGIANDPVIRVIQEIYENAIRAPEPHELPPSDSDEE